MHKGKYVFSQLLSYLDPFVFLRIAKKYGAASQNKKVLGRNRERRKDPDLLRNDSLLHDGHRSEKAEDQEAYLRDATTCKYLTHRDYTA